MKTNLNNVWQKSTWQNLQQNYMQQMWDLFVECRYFKFQNEIQFSSNSIMEQLKHRDLDSFCDHNMSCFYQVLHHITLCIIFVHMFYRVMKEIYQFAANLLSYIPSKYYWNQSTSDSVITKSTRVNFFLKHSVFLEFKKKFLP